MEISLGLFKANECFQICNRRRRTAEFKAAVSFAVINIQAAATPTNISCLFILPLTAYLGPRVTFGVFFSLSQIPVSPIAAFKRRPEELIRFVFHC